MKDQITHLPDNADRSVAKQKFKISNWPTYNKALINRGSITFWLDDEAIQAWYESATPSSRGRPQRYSDLAITTVLVIKRVFRLTLRAAQGFIDSIFSLMNVMSQQHLLHEADLSAILTLPSRLCWSLNAYSG
ncbi:transposase [Klebsiella oxytoca]|uniref:transposase n=1 Tax=Klebsiella oxytoca TaxID=571 RepID=UPI003528BFC6